jgi:hypothetical protein
MTWSGGNNVGSNKPGDAESDADRLQEAAERLDEAAERVEKAAERLERATEGEGGDLAQS